MMFFRALIRPISRHPALTQCIRRSIATLEGSPHIYIHPDPISPNQHILSLLPDPPPQTHHHKIFKNSPSSASSLSIIGTTSTNPPTPSSLTENPAFLTILHSVLSDHAFQDPSIISQAQALASTGGFNLGSGSSSGFGSVTAGGDGAGGASGQGGAGGGGRGGYIHVYDRRNPPDYGRIPFPEDIFGSLEVDARGGFVDGRGRYQESGAYRVLTREGCLGLTPFLREKLIERLRREAGKRGQGQGEGTE